MYEVSDDELSDDRLTSFDHSTFVIRRYAVFRSAVPVQPMLHGVIVAGDNLPAQPLGQMNHQRRFEIQRQRAARMADDRPAPARRSDRRSPSG